MTVEQLREMANRCLRLMAKAQVPEIREQLETWAIDFETEIEEAERSNLLAPIVRFDAGLPNDLILDKDDWPKFLASPPRKLFLIGRVPITTTRISG